MTWDPEKERAIPWDRPHLPPFVWSDASRTPHQSYHRVTAAIKSKSTPRVATVRNQVGPASTKSAFHTVLPRKVHLSRFDPLNRPLETRPDGV
jgi:hypothetical protein